MPPRVIPDLDDDDDAKPPKRWPSPDPATLSAAIEAAIGEVLPGGHRCVCIIIQPDDHLFVVRNVPRDEADAIAKHICSNRGTNGRYRGA